MDAHYHPGAALADDDQYAGMIDRTIRTREGTRFVLGFLAGKPAGLACFAIIRPGRERKGLVFVKDLFVHAEHRGKGLGRTMMSFLASFTLEQGLGRIELATDPANEDAQRLYSDLGGIRRPAVHFTFPD